MARMRSYLIGPDFDVSPECDAVLGKSAKTTAKHSTKELLLH